MSPILYGTFQSAPLRHFLIALSHNRQMQDIIVRVPASRRMARRFVAGERLDDALVAIRSVNANGMLATLDYLGEYVNRESEARANAAEYVRALQAIHENGLKANISIKLTAMGLAINDDFCYDNVRLIAQWAAELGNFVRIDMEDSSVTSRTLAIYRRLRRELANDSVGTVIQSYLYRSQEDVRSLIEEGLAHLRLCKGAYDEPPDVAFPAKADVDQNLFALARMMLLAQNHYPGVRLALASHDHLIINQVRAFAYRQGLPDQSYEIQMLYGIRRDWQQKLVNWGQPLRIYIPYGASWYPYFMRRLAERPANLFFFLRALIGE